MKIQSNFFKKTWKITPGASRNELRESIRLSNRFFGDFLRILEDFGSPGGVPIRAKNVKLLMVGRPFFRFFPKLVPRMLPGSLLDAKRLPESSKINENQTKIDGESNAKFANECLQNGGAACQKSSTNSGKHLQNPAKNLRPISDTHPQGNPPQGAAVSR